MSTGQIVGGVVGAIASFFVPGASTLVYASIGSALGGALTPSKGPVINGPRLDDLSLQTSTYGAVVPRVYGTVSLNGNVFWLENNQLKETVKKKKSGGKGGGGTTTREYSYSATFAVGLCKGPIAGVRRIWVGPDLFYDAGSSDPTTIAASNEAAAGFEVYLGTDTQNADPRMQATLGVANTPAWRGLAYIVFYDLQLAKYANSLAGAQIKVEVMQLGATYTYPYTTFSYPGARWWREPVWDGTHFVSVAYLSNHVMYSPDGLSWTEISGVVDGTNSAIGTDGAGTVVVGGTAGHMYYSKDHGLTWAACTTTGMSGYFNAIGYNGTTWLATAESANFGTSTNGITWTAQTPPVSASYASVLVWSGQKWIVRPATGTGRDVWTSSTGTTGSWTKTYTMLPADSNNFNFGKCLNGRVALFGVATTVSGYGGAAFLSDDHGATWTLYPCPIGSVNGLCVDGYNFWINQNGYMLYSPDGINWTTYANPVNPNHFSTGFGNTYIVCVGQGDTPGFRISRSFVAPLSPPLSTVVSTECQLSGLIGPSDIDVTGLASSSVRGYRVGSVGAIRSALDPLRGAWFFDLVQHGYKIQFKMRGSASVVTIPGSDLDARGAGDDSGISITTAREMVSQLPNRVSVKFLDYEREYDDGEQYARREASTFVKLEVVELPIVMTATEAVGKAETLLYLRWLERYDVSFNLPPTYAQLEPGDVIDVTTPEGNIPLRLVAVNTTAEGRIECKAKYSSAAIYTPTSVGYTPVVTGPTTVVRVGASVYQLMDLPMLSTSQSGPSFLAAMTGALTGWAGGVLMQSTDSGSTWVSLQDFGPPGATMGTCSNSIGTVESRMIDSASTLTVVLSQGALYSVTELAMLGGANYFAYGADGRWEIIAAKTCTLVSGTTYTLTNLLRGRYGTEWAMGLHVGGDTLVLLDTIDTSLIASSSSAIGLSYLYRGITLDRDISTDSNKTFAYQGVNLKPLAPVYFCGYSDPYSGDWSLSWIRRTRTGGDWRDYVNADLGESSEAYEIDVFADDTYATVKRVITVTSPASVYTSAQQVTDFGAAQTDIYLKIYQVSAVVGRGYGLTCSATATLVDGYSATITVPAASVSASLTAFPLFIDLSQMSSEWWSAVWYSDGRDIRALNGSGVEIPTDLVQIDRSARTGALFVKTDLSSAVPTTLTIRTGRPTDGSVDAMDVIGRNAVWTNYHRVLMFGADHANRAGSDYPTTNAQNFSLAVASTSPNTGCHQGVCFDGTHYYVSDTNGLKKYDSAWTVVLTNTDPVGDVGLGTNHVGDIDVHDGILYAPVENYVSISSYSRQYIARFSALTLEYLGSVSISAQGHEASSVAYCDKDGLLYVSSYSDGSRLWKYDPDTLAFVGTLTLSTPIVMIQGVTWWSGAFWVSSGSTKSTTRVEYDGTTRNVVWSTSTADDDCEGIGHDDAGLMVLIDSIASSHNGVVKKLSPIAVAPLPGTDMAVGDQFEYATGLTRHTTWTMGAHVILGSKATNMGILSYTVDGSSNNADRVTLAYRLSSDRFGLWNDTDTWLLDTASPSVGAVYRLNASHNGTSGRKIYRDGSLTNSAGSSTARPSASANVLAVGIESWAKTEDFVGKIGFSYLAPTQFSDAYIAAESSNLLSPASFYTVTG